MFLLGVAVLELNSHPGHIKGPDPLTLQWLQDSSPS